MDVWDCGRDDLRRRHSIDTSICLCCREGENEVWYYSSRYQLDELLEVLDSEKWEADLVAAIYEFRDEVIRQMDITELLTSELRGSKKALLDIEKGKLVAHVRALWQQEEVARHWER